MKSNKNEIRKKLESLNSNNTKQYWIPMTTLNKLKYLPPQWNQFYEQFKNSNSLNPNNECRLKTLKIVLTKLENKYMLFNEMDFKRSHQQLIN